MPSLSRKLPRTLSLSVIALTLSACASTSFNKQSKRPPAAAVASAHPLATAAGMAMLEQGGNAFDAAVAISSTLAVVEPAGSGIGGGGFWLLHENKTGKQVMIDGREKAPLAAHRNMYLDKQGNVIKGLSLHGPLAAGIPGAPKAWADIAENYGRLPLSASLAPAIRHARNGYVIDKKLIRYIGFRHEQLKKSPAAAAIFLDQGAVPNDGFVIRQPALANTLEAIAQRGADGFYRGPVAEALVKGVRANGGIWTQEDLIKYDTPERAPIKSTYRDMKIISAAPPSSGGVVMAQAFNVLEGYDLKNKPQSEQIHLITEAMRYAYRDRARYLGDADFVDMPIAKITSKAYAKAIQQKITNTATDSQSLNTSNVDTTPKGQDTTHFSVLDTEGNRVSATLSINYPLGAAFVVPGTGVLLNDEMDDFSSKPGTPNAYGLVGNEANSIQPGKRMLSSMSPTFVETPQGVTILGTPGGSRIISMVMLGILQLEQGANADLIVSRPRYHHQFLPDVIQHEPGALDKDTMQALMLRSHTFKSVGRQYGNMQAIVWDYKTGVTAASDPRGIGSAQVRNK